MLLPCLPWFPLWVVLGNPRAFLTLVHVNYLLWGLVRVILAVWSICKRSGNLCLKCLWMEFFNFLSGYHFYVCFRCSIHLWKGLDSNFFCVHLWFHFGVDVSLSVCLCAYFLGTYWRWRCFCTFYVRLVRLSLGWRGLNISIKCHFCFPFKTFSFDPIDDVLVL